MNDTLQVTRQLSILELLSESPHGLSIREIYEKISNIHGEVSIRTIRRDIDQLSLNYEIKEEENSYPIRYVFNRFVLDTLTFDMKDIFALTMTQILLKSHVMDSVYLTANKLIEDIIRHSTRFDQTRFELIRNSFLARMSKKAEKDIDMDKMDVILQAIYEKRSLQLLYYGFAKNDLTKRVINPYYFVIQEGHLHLIAFCMMRNEMRDFRVDRINSISILKDHFEKDDGAVNLFERNRFIHLCGSETCKMVLRFSSDRSRYIHEYEAQKADQLLEESDGSLLFIKESAISDEIISWILGFGKHVEVIQPENLRSKVKEEIEKCYKLYS